MIRRLLVPALLLLLRGCAPAPALAQTFYGAGVSLIAQSSPKPSGWAVVATEVNQKQALWSFSETDLTTAAIRNGLLAVQSSARTGIATTLRSFGKWTLYGLADGGVATVGTATGGAYAGGGLLVIPVKAINLLLGVRILKTSVGGTQSIIEIGFGKQLN